HHTTRTLMCSSTCTLCHSSTMSRPVSPPFLPFFSNVPAPTAIYTLSLHDALPIWYRPPARFGARSGQVGDHGHGQIRALRRHLTDRKSTRLNSSHVSISYAVFCLKKKK